MAIVWKAYQRFCVQGLEYIQLGDDDTDQADLSFPPPIGILRILVRRGVDLVASDFGLHPSSDPFVVIEVGQQRWQSSVVEKSLNPVWEHGNVQDFLVYDRSQKANILVYDKDTYSRDDLIGSVLGIDLQALMAAKPCDTDLALGLKGGPAGTLQISSRWFELSPVAPLAGIPPAVARCWRSELADAD
ncbi:CAR3 [Symbiodinium natans]|uniref:CAR3 protein n=1 Tax=Symbiodinium natans TaxID=878477 RepID=A0A812SJ10_9DINO|nr:CAR3 [Symbiodinium natans]